MFGLLTKTKLKSLISFKRAYFSVIGIDIGGSNTCMAILESSGPRVIENAEGLRTTPSYISYQEGGKEEETLIGVNSKKLAVQLKSSTFYGSRHFLTYNKNTILSLVEKKRFPFDIKINQSTDKDELLSPNNIMFFNPYGDSITPIEQTAKFLKYCKEQADGLLGKNIRKVVVSLPNSLYNTNSQNSISSALDMVGLKAIHYIEESKAVVLGYNQTDKKNVLVFNLGGTGFSLSYLKKNKIENQETDKQKEAEADSASSLNPTEEIKQFELKEYLNNPFIGGDDIDTLLTKYLIDEFENKNRADPTKEPSAVQRLREAAEKAKTELSSSNQVEINLPFLMADQKGPKHLQTSITKPKFERVIDPFMSKLRKECEEFKSKIGDEQIDEILLSGGMCRSPLIQDMIKAIFKKEPNKLINPEEAGAIGACIIADTFNKATEEKVSFNTLPLSMGIETLGGIFTRLINKGSDLPVNKTFKLATVYDNQPVISLKLYMGERPLCEDNRLIGDIKLNIPLEKKGKIQAEVNIKCNEEGFLQVKMTELLSKKSSLYTVDLSNGLTNEIIEDVLSVGDKFKDIDELRYSEMSIRKEIDEFLYVVQAELERIKTHIQSSESSKVNEIEERIKELNDSLGNKESAQSEIIESFNNIKVRLEEIISSSEDNKTSN